MSNIFPDWHLISIGRLCASKSTTVDEVLAREDLVLYLQAKRENGVGISSIITFVGRYVSKLVAAALCQLSANESPTSPEKMCSTYGTAQRNSGLANVNATELVTYYLNFLKESRDAVERIVMLTIRVLGNGKVLTPLVAQCFQCIMFEALEVNPFATAEAIATVLDESIVFGVIRNIASSFIVSKTLMALFGLGQTDIHGISLTSNLMLFTDPWIKFRFPQCLALYMPVALRAEGQLPYFLFLKELMECGFSYGVGSVVDVLLEYEVISKCVKDILEGCEEAINNPKAVPFASQGVEVYHYAIALVRKSLIPPDTKDMYTMTVTQIAPLKCMMTCAQPFCDLIVIPETVNPSSYVDSLQVALCEMFVEVFKFQVHETDQIITNINFLEKLLAMSVKYPESNRLSTLLQQAVLLIFADGFNDTDRVIFQHIIAQENPPTRGFLSGCMSICINESYRNTSLSAMMVKAWQTLNSKGVFGEKLGPLRNVIEPLGTHPYLQKRIQNMKTPITGLDFSAIGSGCQETVRHRPLINHAAMHFSMSIESLSSLSCGSPSFEGSDIQGVDVEPDMVDAHIVDETTVDFDEMVSNDTVEGNAVISVSEAPFYKNEDIVDVDTEWTDKTVQKETSSQVYAYPKFSDLQISFQVSEEDTYENSS